jgi:hypothetical protein
MMPRIGLRQTAVKKISDINGGWVLLPVRSGRDTLLLQGAYVGLHVYKKDSKNAWTYAYPVKRCGTHPDPPDRAGQKGTFWLGHAYKGLFQTRLTPNSIPRCNGRNSKRRGTFPANFR